MSDRSSGEGGSGEPWQSRAAGGASSVIRLPQGWVPPPKDSLADRVDPALLWQMIRERLRFIAACAGVAAGLVLVVTMASSMRFKARGSLYLGELQEKAGAQSNQPEQFDLLGNRSGDVGTEIEILKSRDLTKRAILQSGLNVNLVPAGWSPPRYWRWRLARRDLNLLDVGTRSVVPTNVALTTRTNSTRTFKVKFLTDRTYEVSAEGKFLGKGTLNTELITEQVKLTLLPGKEAPAKAGDEYEMSVTPLDQVADSLGAQLTIGTAKANTSNEEIKVINLEFANQSPRAAATFVTTLMDAYLERRQTWKSEEATAAEAFVSKQVNTVKESLDAAESQLADYKKASTVVMLGDEAKQMIDQLAKYEEQRMSARLQMASFAQVDSALKQGKKVPIEQYLVGEGADPVLAGLSNNLSEAQQELTRMQARFTDDAPALREQKTQVDTQLRMVKNYVNGRRARAQGQLDSLNAMIDEFESKLKTVPHAEQQLAQLTRHAEVLSKMYSFLLERQQQVSVAKASSISKNHILDVPEVPYREDAPKLSMRIVLAALVGLLLGLSLVLTRRMMATIFQTEKDLRKELGELPVFGSIPQRRPAPAAAEPGAGALPFDVFATEPHSPFAEAFRHLRANIYYSSPSKDDKVILITSSNQGDGKTLCTLSLAAALVADGKKVLVIEGDMHRPIHHTLFGEPQHPGLSSVLTRQVEWAQALRVIHTAFGTFDAVTAGAVPPSPNELLSSPQFAALVTQAKKNYDFLLIDSPPFPLVSDALVISMLADRVLSVLRLNNSARGAVEEHIRRFSASTPRYGVIMNGVAAPFANGAYGYGPGYGHALDTLPNRVRVHASR